MLRLPEGLPAELVPLAWLLGAWEGTDVLNLEVSLVHPGGVSGKLARVD